VVGDRWKIDSCIETIYLQMAYVKSFRDLEVYKIAYELSIEIFELTKSFPKEELYSLSDQIRRSSRSVGAQIAEAWTKRRYEKHFISKLTDADGEQQETLHWTYTCFDCGYISEEQKKTLEQKLQSIGKMINVMISKSDSFCKNIYN